MAQNDPYIERIQCLQANIEQARFGLGAGNESLMKQWKAQLDRMEVAREAFLRSQGIEP